MINFISVVIPVYNEELNIESLMLRLVKSMKAIGKPFEIILTNDGSKDNSLTLLKQAVKDYPDIVKVIDFKNNFGQHLAIVAGFSATKGDVVVTLDADLQNPPEEIHKVLDLYEKGHDYVGSYRENRQDNMFRTYFSKMVNCVRRKMTDIDLIDHGCMLRAYSRDIVQQIVACKDHSAYIPALAYKFSHSPAEIMVKHASRAAGESNYTLYSLVRLTFDLMTGFTIAPLQLFTMFGMGVSCLSGMLVLYLMVRRLFIGPEAEGLFTLMAVLIFLVSVVILGIGLVGEYVGRLTQNMSVRPCYQIKETYGFEREEPKA